MRPLQLKTKAGSWIPDRVGDDREGRAPWDGAGAKAKAKRAGRIRCGPYNYNDSGSLMAEGVGIRSRTEDASVLPLGGQAPSRRRVAPGHPVKGAHPLQNPRSHPTRIDGNELIW